MEFSALEASSRIILDSGIILTRCDQCHQMHAERMPPEPPNCDELCPVEVRVLREENEEAARIYQIVRGQVIVFGERVIDISIPAIKTVMDLYGVKNQRECMEKVLRLFHHFLKESGNK